MAAYKVSIDELGAKMKEYVATRYADVVKTIQLSLRVDAPRIVQQIIDETVPHPPVDRGTYRRTWKVANVPGGAVLYNPTKYAGIIEYGRQPGTGIGREGIEALTGWVRRHGMQTGKKGADNARSIAFAIAASIKARGTAAKLVLARSKPFILGEIQAGINRVMTTGKF